MILTYLMLIVALCLSTVAAFYSIMGLAAIFAAAVMPIVIMGSILEVAKVTVTIWLHEYWSQCKLAMKAYLSTAVFVLMVLTSMGIFGFLSKAHLDQTVPTGDIVSQVSLFDEKIKNERDTIDNARTLLNQLDKAVTDIGSAPDREVNGRVISSAERALQVRRQQARDRAALTKQIEEAQARIVKLQEERAPLASQARKVEAEVGPIRYVAALIYGDNPDANTLERAVRWVIILIVAVFDPLAIMMLLAATESWKWTKYRRREVDSQQPLPEQPVNDAVRSTRIWAEDLWQRFRKPKNGIVPDDATIPKDLDGHSTSNDLGDQPVVEVVGQSPDLPKEQWDSRDLNQRIQESKAPEQPQAQKIEYRILDDIDEEDPIPVVSQPVKNNDAVETVVAESIIDDDDEDDADDNAMKIAKKLWKADHPSATLKEQRRLHALGHIDRLPWLDYLPDPTSDIGHGAQFPADAKKGDVWIRTDILPTALYKFNGDRWIQIDKNMSDRYSYEQSYIDFLIEQISRGLYDPELLTDAEKGQIETRLRKDLE